MEAYIHALEGPMRLMDLAFQLLGLSITVAELGARAVERLGEAGLLEPLSDGSDPLLHRTEEAYFRRGIPCPVLENGNCSIYEARPSRCREYLVITPTRHRDDPYRNAIGRLPVSVRLNEALTWLWAAMTRQPPALVPLMLALDWAEKTGPVRFVAADAGAMIEHISRDIETIGGTSSVWPLCAAKARLARSLHRAPHGLRAACLDEFARAGSLREPSLKVNGPSVRKPTCSSPKWLGTRRRVFYFGSSDAYRSEDRTVRASVLASGGGLCRIPSSAVDVGPPR